MVAKLDNGKYSLRFEKNYGGVVDALVDAQVRAGNRNIEAYTENFAGIIAAIQDLNVSGDAITGEKPPGWSPDGGDEGTQDPEVPVGTLWFDERQGRLYVYAGSGATSGWYQTNGADGYVYVSPTPPSNPVTGQLWMDTDNNNQLFVMVNSGTVDPSLAAVYGNSDQAVVMEAVWVPIGGSTTVTSTANLPLATPTRITGGTLRSNIDWPEVTGLTVQKDYNEWILDALNSIDIAVEELEELAGNAIITVSEDPPDTPEEGNLWFDTNRLDLNVYYDGYWVSTGAPDMVTFSAASVLDEKIEYNSQQIYEKQLQISQLFEAVRLNKNQSDLDTITLNSEINAIRNNIDGFIKLTDVTAITDALNERLSVQEIKMPDLTGYSTTSEINEQLNAIEATLTNYDTATSVDQKVTAAKIELTALIPDITGKADKTYVDDQLNALDYLPASGGTIDGFVFTRGNISVAGLDFSNRTADGINAMAFKPVGCDHSNSFGVGPGAFEMAWQFNSNEDYCWLHGTNKVASINQNGIACSDLKLTEFYPNTLDGVNLYNTIDVRERLNTYKSAFTNLRTAVQNATDFDTLKSAIVTALAGV